MHRILDLHDHPPTDGRVVPHMWMDVAGVGRPNPGQFTLDAQAGQALQGHRPDEGRRRYSAVRSISLETGHVDSATKQC
jgi:hypothetical protein